MKRIFATVTYLLKANQVLMVYGDKPHAPHYLKWNGPGGKMEEKDNNDPVACATRETEEETGLTPLDLKLAATIYFTGMFPGKEFVVYYYTSPNFTGELKPKEGDEEARWCEIANGLPNVPILDGDMELFNRIITGPYFEGQAKYDGRENWLGFTEGPIPPENKEGQENIRSEIKLG